MKRHNSFEATEVTNRRWTDKVTTYVILLARFWQWLGGAIEQILGEES